MVIRLLKCFLYKWYVTTILAPLPWRFHSVARYIHTGDSKIKYSYLCNERCYQSVQQIYSKIHTTGNICLKYMFLFTLNAVAVWPFPQNFNSLCPNMNIPQSSNRIPAFISAGVDYHSWKIFQLIKTTPLMKETSQADDILQDGESYDPLVAKWKDQQEQVKNQDPDQVWELKPDNSVWVSRQWRQMKGNLQRLLLMKKGNRSIK